MFYLVVRLLDRKHICKDYLHKHKAKRVRLLVYDVKLTVITLKMKKLVNTSKNDLNTKNDKYRICHDTPFTAP